VAVTGADGLAGLVGRPLPPTPWLTLGRPQHLRYDEATFMAPSTNYPGGETATWIHGAHALGLAPPLFEQTVAIHGFAAVVMYGFDRVRFPSPLAIGARVRARFDVLDAATAPGGVQCRVAAAIEAEDAPKPACVADLLLRLTV